MARYAFGDPATAYAAVFVAEAALFVLSARLAMGVFGSTEAPRPALGRGVVTAG